MSKDCFQGCQKARLQYPAFDQPETKRSIITFDGKLSVSQIDEHNINSNKSRYLKLSTFRYKLLKLWFAQLESEFMSYQIHSNEIKYN